MTSSPEATVDDTTAPEGLWKNIDATSGLATALIRVTQQGGELTGVVVKVYNMFNANPICTACVGENHGKPIVGLAILTGMRRDGEKYSGGQLLDPSTGKTYRSSLEIADDGKTLRVRGYIGIPSLGRTQIWRRQE